MPSPIQYTVELLDAHAHVLGVAMRIDRPSATTTLSLPVWIPGSYLVREFAQHLQHLRAEHAGQPVAAAQLNKNTWQVTLPDGAPTDEPLWVYYDIYAFDQSVRTAYFDAQRLFFNGTSLCLRVHGRERVPHDLDLLPPDDIHPWVAAHPDVMGWRVSTGLPPGPNACSDDGCDEDTHSGGFGRYTAQDYDELVDCPFEVGHLWQRDFEACGVPHSFVITGAPAGFDGERLIADTQRICEAQIRFWHGDQAPPFARYVFQLHVTADGYGGLEHRNSTALIAKRADLPTAKTPASPNASDGYTTLLGLISHEYFHTWNVKRLRPDAFARYDYDRENHTTLLWFFEGFTSYYDDLFLARTGLISQATYLELISKAWQQLTLTPGRQVQTVAQASFDAWTKYYRVNENTPNATVSYYGKGALVALCLDLTLRAEGKTTLDDLMRGLWQHCQAGPMRHDDVLAVLQQLTGRSYQPELDAWVNSTQPLPVVALLQQAGVASASAPLTWGQRLGLRASETNGKVMIQAVLNGGAAHQAGLSAQDEWLSFASDAAPRDEWRLTALSDLDLLTQTHTPASTEATAGGTLRIARAGRLHTLHITWPRATPNDWVSFSATAPLPHAPFAPCEPFAPSAPTVSKQETP